MGAFAVIRRPPEKKAELAQSCEVEIDKNRVAFGRIDLNGGRIGKEGACDEV
jgi:hypothetical protein